MRRPLAVLSLALAVAAVAAAGGSIAAQERPKADPTRRDLSAYRLRVEDEVEITVYKPGSFDPAQTRRLVVPANGEVSYPPIGKINLLGQTAFEVEERIATRLKEENFLTQPNVGCLVTKHAPRTVSVMGAVNASVELPVHRDLRILELLTRVQGLDKQGADLSRVEIRRVAADGRPFKFTVDVERVFNQLDEQPNVVVMEGDIVKIPPLESSMPQAADFVYVLGKVGSRGRIPIVRGRNPFTIVKLIAICGDFSEFADRNNVRIIRTTETGRQLIEIDFDDILENKRPDFELKPDDVVFVPESFL